MYCLPATGVLSPSRLVLLPTSAADASALYCLSQCRPLSHAASILPANNDPQAKVQEQAECTRRAEEALGEAQRRADDLRQDVQRLQQAEERWRKGKAAAGRALALLQEGLEAMP
jgi:hypothetical protein